MEREQETLPLFRDLPPLTALKRVIDWDKVNALDLSTAKGRLFHLLAADGGWHSSVEISGPACAGLGYGSCLSDLRKMGAIPEHRYHVNAHGEQTSYYDYRLTAEFIADYRRS